MNSENICASKIIKVKIDKVKNNATQFFDHLNPIVVPEEKRLES